MPDLWTVAVTYEDHDHTRTDRHVATDEVWDSIYDMMPAHLLGPVTITITPED